MASPTPAPATTRRPASTETETETRAETETETRAETETETRAGTETETRAGTETVSGDGDGDPVEPVEQRPIVYQLVVRHFGNTNQTRALNGSLAENGVGKFADIDSVAIAELVDFGVTHVWLTGVLRQANFTPGGAAAGPVRLPEDLIDAIGLAGEVTVRKRLDRSGAVDEIVANLSAGALASAGFLADVEIQTSHVYVIE
jgi:hypothetical protein